MFAAVYPPAEVIEDLAAYVDPRRQADDRLRWSGPGNWHITTLFADSVPERSLDPLIEGLAALAERTAPFDVRIAGSLAFPNPYEARVLGLDITTGVAQLGHLSRTARAAASHAGIVPDGSRFHPHLTLARAKRPFEATKWLTVLGSFPGWTFRAAELVLLESYLRQGPTGGPRHVVLERFRFTADAPGPAVP